MSKQSIVLPGTPIKRARTMHDLAFQQIGSSIVSGHYPVGSLLPSKEDLMADLGVSNTTIREALQTLAAKGLIAARARVGTRVLEHSHWNMFDADVLTWRLQAGMPIWMLSMLIEVRQSIEPLAAALAAIHHSTADLAKLRDLLVDMQDYPGRGEGFVNADVAFHQLVLGMSGNAFMASLAALTSAALSASFQLSAPRRDSQLSTTVHDQHAAIVDAIEARDPQAASDAMMAAIRQGWINCGGGAPARLAGVELLSFPSGEQTNRTAFRRQRARGAAKTGHSRTATAETR